MKRHFYAFTDTERIVDLGEHYDFDSADSAAPPNTHWIFDRTGLEQLHANISELIGGQK